MDDQQFFNNAYTQALTMPGPSIRASTCLYRGPNGNKCLVGISLPDAEYRSSWDDVEDPAGANEILPECPTFSKITPKLARFIQEAHDEGSSLPQGVEDWRAGMLTKLRLAAREYSLTVPA